MAKKKDNDFSQWEGPGKSYADMNPRSKPVTEHPLPQTQDTNATPTAGKQPSVEDNLREDAKKYRGRVLRGGMD